jgi:hypothetical protein
MNFDTCFECGEPGHMAAGCPARLTTVAPAKPEWCGECDRQTRLIEGVRHGRQVAWRCARCHPLAHRELPQHKRCGGCKALTYSWDRMECGKHQPLALG